MTKLSGETPSTLGSLRQNPAFSEERLAARTVKDELRANLICKLQKGEALFPGVLGFEDTVVPQMVNAVLSRHNFILLGLRGQAKTRLIRLLTTLLDQCMPLHRRLRDPRQPVPAHLQQCRDTDRRSRATRRPSPGWRREQRYVEKLATPDVTIADMIGDHRSHQGRPPRRRTSPTS